MVRDALDLNYLEKPGDASPLTPAPRARGRGESVRGAPHVEADVEEVREVRGGEGTSCRFSGRW